MTKIIIKRFLFLSCVCLLTACGAPKKMIELEDAHAFYNTVSRDPVVARNAALELEDAKNSLQKAKKHWEEGADKRVVKHYAYMTDQQLAIAQYRAKLLENNDRLNSLTLEYQQVQRAANAQEDADAKNVAMVLSRQAEGIIIKASELERHVSDLEVHQTDRGLVITLGYELFDNNSASLHSDAVPKVAKVAGLLSEYPKQNVLIEGHTDTMGDNSYNQELSARRAESVKLALVLKGVEAERVVTRGLGESSPRVANAGTQARLSNRRVEIIFAKDTKPQVSRVLGYYRQPESRLSK